MSSRGAGFAGLSCFALLAAATIVLPLWEIPGTNAPASDLVAFLAPRRTATDVSIFIYALAMGAYFPFAAGVWSRLRAAEPEPRMLSATFALATAAMLAVILVGFMPVAVAAYRIPTTDDAVLLRDLSFAVLGVSGVPTAAQLTAYALIVRGTGCMPSWTAALALVAALAHVAIAATLLFHNGFLSLEGLGIVFIPATWFVWMLATSVVLVREPSGSR